MRLGVMSDIHGVVGGLAAVLDDGRRLGVERWWALGDLVLFGPDPVEVLEMLGGLVLNPGSVGLPRTIGAASWILVDGSDDGATVEHRAVDFDVAAVVDALYRRRHPNREFIASVLTRDTFVED